jgi:hypothetical protein
MNSSEDQQNSSISQCKETIANEMVDAFITAHPKIVHNRNQIPALKTIWDNIVKDKCYR